MATLVLPAVPLVSLVFLEFVVFPAAASPGVPLALLVAGLLVRVFVAAAAQQLLALCLVLQESAFPSGGSASDFDSKVQGLICLS